MINKFKEALKRENVTPQEFSKEVGIKHGTFRSLIVSGAKVPRWVKSFLFGYRLGKIKNIDVDCEEVPYKCPKCNKAIHEVMGMSECYKSDCPQFRNRKL